MSVFGQFNRSKSKIRLVVAIFILILILLQACQAQDGNIKNQQPTYCNKGGLVKNLADPFVLKYQGVYYLYGTDETGANGFYVYTSKDLVHWKKMPEKALKPQDSWGNKWFWAPEVVFYKGRFYMFYSVQEHLAVAVSKSPLGPFVQKIKRPLHPAIKEIDPHVFFDDDGKKYLYFVRFNAGNVIWVAELNDDLLSIKENTLTECIRQSQDWERSKDYPAAVNEGPFVLKHKGYYYLTYSANHFRSIDYGVGYAVSKSPFGPWLKYAGNPILKRNDQVHGPGHHSFVYSPNGTELFIIYHTHNSLTKVTPRNVCIDRAYFVPDPNGGPDILKVKGPTTTPQPMPE